MRRTKIYSICLPKLSQKSRKSACGSQHFTMEEWRVGNKKLAFYLRTRKVSEGKKKRKGKSSQKMRTRFSRKQRKKKHG